MGVVSVWSISERSVRQLWMAIGVSLTLLALSGVVWLVSPFSPTFSLDWTPRDGIGWRLLWGDLLVVLAGVIGASISMFAEQGLHNAVLRDGPHVAQGGHSLVQTIQIVGFGTLVIGVGLIGRHLYLMMFR